MLHIFGWIQFLEVNKNKSKIHNPLRNCTRIMQKLIDEFINGKNINYYELSTIWTTNFLGIIFTSLLGAQDILCIRVIIIQFMKNKLNSFTVILTKI
jgi:hypothetical protein